MKRLTSLVAASLVLALGVTAQAQIDYYLDVNDDAPGSGVTDGSIYAWNTSGLGWNTINADGTQASPGLNVAFANGNNAIFSAGTDATGALYGFNIAAGTTAANATIEEGTVQIVSGVFDTGAGDLTIKPSAGVKTIAGGQFNGAGRLVLQGTTPADAAVVLAANPGSAGTMISNLKTIDIQGFGRFSYDNGDSINDNVVSIINGSIITGGATATPTNGGSGTLVKSGPDQIGYAPRDIGADSSARFNSFAKVRVEQGTFRLRNATINGVVGVTDERLFGAVPLSPLADAITLDGGGIGTSTTVTLNANRGLTIGPNGGFFDHGAGASFVIPGPLTAAPGALFEIGSPTSTSASAPGITFSNPGNATTFQGNIFMLRATMTLNSSLNVANFSGTGPSATVFGTVAVAASQTLTVGSDGADTFFDGRITGAGIVTKVGAGTMTLNPNPAGGATEWGNTGGVNINNGVIKYATGSQAGFSNAVPVTIGATGKLNMNGVNDTIGSLAGPVGGIVDMNDGGAAATPSNLTLASGTPVDTTYSGTIVGGGNLTKSSSSTQKFAGNLALGTVALNGGSTIVNSPATMTATGGVTIAALGSLGGTGIIAGNVTNNGVIAPGDGGVGTLSVTGTVTEATGAILHIELSGANADKLAVTGNIDLSAAGDVLSVTGAGTGSSWVIGTYTGSESGVFDSITSGYTVTYAGGNITLNAAVGFPGDFNNDGHLDAGDYVSIRKQFSDITTGPGLAAYAAWRQNYGNPPGGGTSGGLSNAPVPEPASLALLVIGLATFGLGRRQRVA